MRLTKLALLLGVPVIFAACAPSTGVGSSSSDVTADAPGASEDIDAVVRADLPPPESFDAHATTAHFRLSWNAAESSDGEVRAVEAVLEDTWDRLTAWVGASRMPTGLIDIQLEGDGMKPGQPPAFPWVGGKGRVHLFRYAGGPSGAYERQLVHELVHATRVLIGLHDEHEADYETGFGFVEEGFAEINILTDSRLFAMAVAVARLVVGGVLDTFNDRRAFEDALARAVNARE